MRLKTLIELVPAKFEVILSKTSLCRYQKQLSIIVKDTFTKFTKFDRFTKNLGSKLYQILNSKTVKKVLGLKANSFYLHATAQNNPTGYFCRYKEEKDFRPDPCSKFGYQSYQWITYVVFKEKTFLQTRFNMGERRVSKYSLPVDGYSE